MNKTIAIPVTEMSQVGDVRRTVAMLSTRMGFDDTEGGRLAILVNELATNLVLHATGGEILLRPLSGSQHSGIEVLAVDRGPGIADVERCLRDGYSTAGTAGNGLGAVMRMADVFDIHSTIGSGTVVMVRVWADSPPTHTETSEAPGMEVGAVCVPKAGEETSGDSYACHLDLDRNVFLMADGLGHGPSAAAASLAAIRVIENAPDREPAQLLEEAHTLLRGTRGAAVAVAVVNRVEALVRFAGIGNIAGAVLTPDGGMKSMVSHNGIVGHQVRKFQEFTYPWPEGGVLILHSDGLGSQWRLEQYPGILARHPSLIAGVLYRDFHRGRDDVAVLVARARRGNSRYSHHDSVPEGAA